MNTWIYKASTGLLGLFLLGACGQLPELLEGQGDDRPPLRNVTLARGKVFLIPPEGFCIDRQTLKDRFALMARCAVMGGKASGSTATYALITASITDAPRDGAIKLAATGERAQAETRAGALQMAAVTGDPPSDKFATRYWRGAGPVGPYVLGLTVYAPEDNPAPDSVSKTLLAETFSRTEAQTVARMATIAPTPATAPRNAGSGDTKPKKRPGGFIAGLFRGNQSVR